MGFRLAFAIYANTTSGSRHAGRADDGGSSTGQQQPSPVVADIHVN